MVSKSAKNMYYIVAWKMHLEVGITKGFFCTWPLLWVPPQHVLHQAHRLLARLVAGCHKKFLLQKSLLTLTTCGMMEASGVAENCGNLKFIDAANLWPEKWLNYLLTLKRTLKRAKTEKTQTLRPVPLVGGAQHWADLEDLVDLGVAGEERAEGVELRHDAAHRPDVNRGGIESAAKTNISFGCISFSIEQLRQILLLFM